LNFSNGIVMEIGWLRLHLHDVYGIGFAAKTLALVRRRVARVAYGIVGHDNDYQPKPHAEFSESRDRAISLYR
jgi:hypothetical protein